MISTKKVLAVVFCFFILIGCDEAKDSVENAIDDAEELANLQLNKPERKEINVSKTGVNAFFVNPGFGSTRDRFNDISSNLRLSHIRSLFSWEGGVQPTPDSAPKFGLYDEIVSSAPENVDILVVVAHTPSWMTNPANWIDGNPRKTWVERWLKPVLRRYGSHPRVVGFEIWNEPDAIFVESDRALELSNPSNYYELLELGAAAAREIAPTKLILNAATEAINQSFPRRLNYNKDLVALGADKLVDVWNVHYYGEQFENVVIGSGVANFLNSLDKEIWITESGEMGYNNQLKYVETVWPFLREEIKNLDRIYYYQYTSVIDGENGFGLRNNSANSQSDLYQYLASR